MKPGLLAGVIVAAIIGVGGLAFIATREKDTSTSARNTSQTSQPTTNNSSADTENAGGTEETTQTTGDATEPAEGLTAAEVAEHNTSDDCWTIINNSVYDITEYVPRHPGGDDIILACGSDGTSLFMSRTTEDGETVGSGEPHSSKAQNQLAQFKIGDLN